MPVTPAALLGLGVGGDHHQRERDLEIGEGAAGTLRPALERGQRRLADELRGRERVDHEAVGDLARDLGHPRADAAEHRCGGGRTGSARD